MTADYLAAGFTPDEQWRLWAHGNGGRSSLRGRRLEFDFSQGANSIAIGPPDFSLLGNPRKMRLRVRGSAPGHPVRMQIATHFMTWTFYDQVVATAKRHGISVYGLLAYWSPWTKPYTAAGIEDYCRFAAAAATRYRDDIQDWEVYNEPNIFFWQGPRDMYAELLIKAHAAIKEANPPARVLGCSTAGIDLDFIRRTMELGATFDVLTIHPYRSRMDDRQFIADLQEAAEVVKLANGERRPVWITEMGWATHVLHNDSSAGFRVTTQRDQACLIARSYIDAIASGVAPNISWYDFRNDGTDPFNFEHNMGIVTRDFRPKPAYRAYATVATMLDGLHVDGELNLGENVFAYRFVDDEGESTVLALWSTLGQQTIRLPATEDHILVDLMGGHTTLEPTDGGITIAPSGKYARIPPHRLTLLVRKP